MKSSLKGFKCLPAVLERCHEEDKLNFSLPAPDCKNAQFPSCLRLCPLQLDGASLLAMKWHPLPIPLTWTNLCVDIRAQQKWLLASSELRLEEVCGLSCSLWRSPLPGEQVQLSLLKCEKPHGVETVLVEAILWPAHQMSIDLCSSPAEGNQPRAMPWPHQDL